MIVVGYVVVVVVVYWLEVAVAAAVYAGVG